MCLKFVILLKYTKIRGINKLLLEGQGKTELRAIKTENIRNKINWSKVEECQQK